MGCSQCSGGFVAVSGLQKCSSGIYLHISIPAVEVCFPCVELPCFCTVLTKEGDGRLRKLAEELPVGTPSVLKLESKLKRIPLERRVLGVCRALQDIREIGGFGS